MSFFGFVGTVIYALSIASLLYIIAIKYDVLIYEEGTDTSYLNFSIFAGNGEIYDEVTQEVVNEFNHYEWCEGSSNLMTGETEDRLCLLLRLNQYFILGSIAVGLVAMFTSFMINCGSIKEQALRGTQHWTSTLILVQTIATGLCIAAWYFIKDTYQTYLDESYNTPGALGIEVDYAEGFMVLIGSAVLSLLAFVSSGVMACKTPVPGGKYEKAHSTDEEMKDQEIRDVIATTY
jgi:hypothetical protein